MTYLIYRNRISKAGLGQLFEFAGFHVIDHIAFFKFKTKKCKKIEDYFCCESKERSQLALGWIHICMEIDKMVLLVDCYRLVGVTAPIARCDLSSLHALAFKNTFERQN